MAALALSSAWRLPRLRLAPAAAVVRRAALRRSPPPAPRPAAPIDPIADIFLIDGERLPPEAAAALAETLREPDLPRDGAAYAVGGAIGVALILLSALVAIAALRALVGVLA